MKHIRKLTVLGTLLLGVILWYAAWRYYTQLTQPVTALVSAQVDKREPWVTVFVHGTFGTALGFFSFMPVVKDHIKGSTYNKLLRKMRKDPFFYKDQPIFARGLHRITPTFDLAATQGKKLGAPPIAQAFDVVQEAIAPGKYRNDYYTFGWTGFISKTRRRREAIRLYNALSALLEQYQAQGLKPKIRLVTHSHGGNLALQLAGINELLLEGREHAEQKYTDDKDRHDALIDLVQLFSHLPDKASAQKQPGQKRYDYLPERGGLVVDELILLGIPVQPETDHYCSSPTFKNVYNIYSSEDYIQKMDWVSSRRYFSEQRFDVAKWKKNTVTGTAQPTEIVKIVTPATHVVQAKIMVSSEDNTIAMTPTHVANNKQEETVAWWKKLFVERAPQRRAFDPSHKELWFITRSTGDEGLSVLSPLPTVVFVPIFSDLLARLPQLDDVDFHLSVKEGKVHFHVTAHNERASKYGIALPVALINELKAKIISWSSDAQTREKEFEILRSYVQ